MGDRWKDSTLSILFTHPILVWGGCELGKRQVVKNQNPPPLSVRAKSVRESNPSFPTAPRTYAYDIQHTEEEGWNETHWHRSQATNAGVHWTDFNRGIWSNASDCLSGVDARIVEMEMRGLELSLGTFPIPRSIELIPYTRTDSNGRIFTIAMTQSMKYDKNMTGII